VSDAIRRGQQGADMARSTELDALVSIADDA
jgi:hypothetical protein